MSEAQLHNARHWLSQGQYQQAIDEYENVLAVQPQNVDAWAGVAMAYSSLGKWLEALNGIVNALGYGGYQQKELVILLQILEVCQLNSYVEPIEKALQVALETRWLEGQAIEFLQVQLMLKYQQVFSQDVISLDETVEQVLADPSFYLLLERTIIPNHQYEQIVLLGRTELLRCIANNLDARHHLPTMAAIACQNLLNDGLYHTSEEEVELLKQLDNCDPVFQLEAIALKLCYADFDQAIELWQQHSELFKFSKLKRLADDLAFYHSLRSDSPQASRAVKDKTSKVVQSFYSDNPYPKYKVVKVGSMSVGMNLARLGLEHITEPQILVAGCGTGLQAIELAFANRDGQVTAIDISPTSIRYGQLMAERYELTNIEFKLLDILEVKSLGQEFDYIVSTGVLHHMESPQDGLNALSQVLKSERAMVLGFYSQLGRQDLAKIRTQVEDFFTSDATDIKKSDLSYWRSQWSVEDKKEYWFGSNDFFNLNGLMDAIFHPQEAFYDLMAMRRMLQEAGVTFKSMAISASQRARYTEALSNIKLPGNVETLMFWHQFEQKHPYFFAGMYNFFAIKR